jgi:DNA-binding MarR family transcriptional regulator
MTTAFAPLVCGLTVLRREEPDLSLTAAIAFLTLATLPKGTTVPNLDLMLDLDPGTMTRTMPQLLARELVMRQRDPQDRRTFKVRVSSRGAALAAVCAAALKGDA